METTDIVIAGGGFAGLACATALARAGVAVTLLERKKSPGIGMHTTGIIVKECADEFAIPPALTRKVTEVRLYAPSLRYADLAAPDYFFLTTDTPALMRHLSDEAARVGARILYGTAYESGQESGGRIAINGGQLSCRFLVGADGPRSRVAEDFALGKNTRFLLGAEAEYTGLSLPGNAFCCFLDQRLAPGYLGWVIPGVGVTQVGLAARMPARPDIEAFASRIRPLFDFSQAKIAARRGGLIPVGGLVRPFARENVLLVGDAAGIVSPLTAGGIHTALRYGKILGENLATHLHGGPHPGQLLAQIYPRFYAKRLLRAVFERTPDWTLNMTIGSPLFAFAAREVFFRKKRLK